MKLILDAMGGDNAPLEIIRGAALAIAEYSDIELTVTGRKAEIAEICRMENISTERMIFIDCPDVITMEDSPRSVVAAKKNSSMTCGLRALASGEGDAFISAGNTGALMTGATVLIHCCDGIKHGAIGTVLPMEKPLLMLDSGSNVTVTSELLVQFAVLGSVYAEAVLGIKTPRVGLLNNGTEEHKGTPTVAEAYKLLKEAEGINFVGNIEGNRIPFGECDVLVTDGFTGNIVLKTVEGFSKFLMGQLKSVYRKNAVTMLSAAMIKGELASLQSSFDASEYGGAPFLGIAKPVFKAHGSSDAKAIKNAIAKAREYVLADAGAEINRRMAALGQ